MVEFSSIPFAVLLPLSLKSFKCYEESPIHRFAQLLNSFQSKRIHLEVYIGYDDDDTLLIEHKEELHQLFTVKMYSRSFEPTKPVKICHIWRSLARQAFTNKCKYFVLLGDDIHINDCTWPEKIVDEFLRTKDFGCVAINDCSSTASGFPTFPVVSWIHMEIFKGEVIPEEFINQDGDPYLFALYRSFAVDGMAAARFIHKGVQLANQHGGPKLSDIDGFIPSRYEAVHINWKDEILVRGVRRLNEWIHSVEDKMNISKVLTIDIVVPCFNHVSEKALEPIVSLIRSESGGVNLKVILIIDKPSLVQSGGVQFLRKWEKKEEYFGKLLVRVNDRNRGASFSRNSGLNESSAEYVIFLDDDVSPRSNLVSAYAAAIKKHGKDYAGYVGVTLIADSENSSLWNKALRLSGVSYFWDIAIKQETTPWGITANQCVKRISGISFDEEFSRTGGGEDIDFNIKLCRMANTKFNVMRCVSDAICDHPRWHDVHRHVFHWGWSDSILITKYPELTYNNWPNAIESSLLLSAFTVCAAVAATSMRDVAFISKLIGLSFTSPLVVDAIFDISIVVYDSSNTSLKSIIITILSAMIGNSIKNAVELGHFMGPISRFRWIPFLRFDWFCSTIPEVIQDEKIKAKVRFMIFLTVWLILLLGFMLTM